MPEEYELRATLQFKLDKASADKLKRDIGSVADGTEQVEKSLEQVEKKLQDINDVADGLATVGETMAVSGALALASITAVSQKYIQYSGLADSYSRRWLATQGRLEQAQVRIGRVATQSLLPVMEKIADLAESAASFAEQHPGAIKAAVGIAGTIAALGTLVTTTAKIMQAYTTIRTGMLAIQKMTVAGGAASTGTAAGGAIAGGTATGGAVAGGAAIGATVLGGILLGGGAYQAIATSKFGRQAGMANLQQYASVLAYGLGKLTGSTERAQRWFTKVATSLGALDRSARSTATSISNVSRVISQAAVDVYIEYSKQRKDIIEQYEQDVAETTQRYAQQRADIVKSYEQTIASITRDYKRAEARAYRDFMRQETKAKEQYDKQVARMLQDAHERAAEAEREYYNTRKQLSEQYSIELQRLEQDHQRRMLQMRQQYDLQQQDAIAARDANAFIQNQRRYELQRQQAEQEYNVTVQRRREDFAKQLRDLEAHYREQRALMQSQLQKQLLELKQQYEEQRAERLAQYEQEKAERAEAYNEQMQATKEQYRQQLNELESAKQQELATLKQQHDKQLNELERALAEQLSALDQNLLSERELRNRYYEQMTQDLEQWLENNAAMWSRTLYGGAQRRSSYGSSYDSSYGSSYSSFEQYNQYSNTLSDWYRQSGGYVGSGLYRVGEQGYEFVLSHDTTRFLESVAGGRLTQQTIQKVVGGTQHVIDINVSGEYNDALVPVIQDVVLNTLNDVVVRLNSVQ